MKIIENEDKELVKKIREELKNNDGYCPCRLQKIKENKCPCKEFRDSKDYSLCLCGLYLKIQK